MRQLFHDLQDEIEAKFTDLDGEGAFEGEATALPHGGLSRPRVLQDGANIEKAAVLFTHAIGPQPSLLPPRIATRTWRDSPSRRRRSR